MPLRFDVEEYLGTNADQSHNDEYCYYCLKDGEYTVDIPMNEMVDIWVKYTDKYNWYSGTNYTPQELKTLLNKRLPALKRWRQKEETENIHHEAVRRIKTYIDHNLFSVLDSEQLAVTANLSFFHFRRVFKNITGENIGTYIQRLRLEYVAHLLIATNQSIGDIQKQTNYETKFSLAKAFKKHWGLPMSEYRTKYSWVINRPLPDNLPKADIKRISTQNAVCLEVKSSFLNKGEYNAIWKQLIHYRKNHLPEAKEICFVCISQDNPAITPVEKRRFYIGCIVNHQVSVDGKFSIQEIPGGMYAVFRHKGNYSLLPELYRSIYEQWFPQSSYQTKETMTFELYLNSPNTTTNVSDLETEVYIPIERTV